MPSFRDINYALRPAKAVERKMMAESFRRLHSFRPVSEYQYIGFGSIYFTDFLLFHLTSGLDDMVSIERVGAARQRLDFNRPFNCIDIHCGESADVLPALRWQKPTIAWLDYDGPLDSSVLADISTVTQRCHSGSLLIVSINVETPKPPQDTADVDAWRLENFTERLGVDNVPSGTLGRHLRGPDLKQLCYRILSERVRDQIALRNGRSDRRPDTFLANQVFHIHYADGAAMMTLAWVIYRADEEETYNKCQFPALPFFRGDASFYSIVAPHLTPKEIRRLNAIMPQADPLDGGAVRQLIADTGVPESDITNFSRIYKFYPMFAEVVL